MHLIRTLMHRLSRVRHEERGAVLLIFAGAMLTLLAIAALAIDMAIWHVHARHLQTQADAAAFAGAQALARDYENGSCTDTDVTSVVAQYDGTSSTGFNAQVPIKPDGTNGHNLYDAVNAANYTGQSAPGDSGLTGSPCTDAAIDTKMTETNLPSYFPFVGVPYLNKQARVALQTAGQSAGELPLSIPAPTPGSVKVELVDESNGSVVGAATSLTGNSSGESWTGTVPLSCGSPCTSYSGTTSSTFPLGLVVATGSGPSAASLTTTGCFASGGTGSGSTTDICYGSGSATNGIYTTRVWKLDTSTNGTNSVQAEAVWFAKTQGSSAAASDCSGGPTTGISNFFNVSSSAGQTVTLCANMYFPASSNITCAKTKLKVTNDVDSSTVNMSCPASGAGVLNEGTWYGGVTIPQSGSTSGKTTYWGPINYSLGWTISDAITKPYNASSGSSPCGTSSSTQCGGSISNVQRAFLGAYSSTTVANASNPSGPINGVSITYNSGSGTTASPLTSVQNNNGPTSVTVTLSMIGFKTGSEITQAGTSPTALSFGGNQGIATIQCTANNNGNGTLTSSFINGCSNQFQSTTTDTCTASSPYTCVQENPGGAKSTDVDTGISQRINSTGTCKNYNYWAWSNTVAQVEANKSDPRLVGLIITDYGGLANGSAQEYIRHFAEFYVTGYYGDPCASIANGTSNGLNYTADDSVTTSGVIVGHFVSYVSPPGTGITGSGTSCQLNSFDQCVEVITR